MINAPSIDAMSYALQTTTGTDFTVDKGYDLGIIDTPEETNNDVVEIGSKGDETVTNGEELGKNLKNIIKDSFKALFTDKEGNFSKGKTGLLAGTLALPVVAALVGVAPLPALLATGIYGGIQLGAAVAQGLKTEQQG